MGHKSITVALFLGLLALPLACGGDDDESGGVGGKGGKAGAAGKGGKAGAAGKGAAGKGGSSGTGTGGSGGTSGTGGSKAGTGSGGTAGGKAGTGNGGAGGSKAGSGGTDNPGGAGQGQGGGGDSGGGNTPEEHRAELCDAICSLEIPMMGAGGAGGEGGGSGALASCGHEEECAAALCDTTNWDAGCVETLDDFLECVHADTELSHFSCYDDDTGLNTGYSGPYTCYDTWQAWSTCVAGGH